jgi:hypothetical protein
MDDINEFQTHLTLHLVLLGQTFDLKLIDIINITTIIAVKIDEFLYK